MGKTQYLNVDLEIESRTDVAPIVEDFGDGVIILFNGEIGDFYRAVFETADSLAGADEVIGFFCKLIEDLPSESREIWDNCINKVFDIGYESGDTSPSYSTELRSNTIERIANCGASVKVTIYPSPDLPKKT